MSEKIIHLDRSVIVAADVAGESFPNLVHRTSKVSGIGGYKIGFGLGLELSLGTAVSIVKDNCDLATIYDHQKAGNDIPDTGELFARTMKRSGVDAAIFFPFTGPKVLESWVKASQDAGIKVIVGGFMTHDSFIEDEGGFIANGAPMQIYELALDLGVRDFVMPGNKPDKFASYKRYLENSKPSGEQIRYYAPGFVAQGGKVSETGKIAGDFWHAIAGRGIFEAQDITKAAQEITSQL